MAAKVFTPWTYVSDDGNTYRVNSANYINTQLDNAAPKIGGAQATVAALPKPKFLKMRCALAYDSVSGTVRRVPVMTVDAYLWATPGGTIQLNVGQPTVLTTFTTYGLEGERTRHSKKLA